MCVLKDHIGKSAKVENGTTLELGEDKVVPERVVFRNIPEKAGKKGA